MVDLPTKGRPTRPTVALPDFLTANDRPAPPPIDACFSCCARRAAILALSFPMWNSVALFFCVLKISASISLIWSAIVPTAHRATRAAYKRSGAGDKEEGASAAPWRGGPGRRDCAFLRLPHPRRPDPRRRTV